MSHYRERRDKIKNLQSKSLDHLASGAASKDPSDAHQPGPLEQSQSQRRLRESSPRWKEHYSKISQQWSSGISLTQQESNVVWEDVRQQKEKGGYPYTHLSHHQDEEVWLNPQKLPQDIGSVTMLRKDNTIPREWFHLPKGAEVPTVDDLLRDSTPELDIGDEEAVAKRAKSPPICGRHRSKSRERVPNKHHAASSIGLQQRPQTPMSYDESSVTNITPAPSVYSFQHHATEQPDKLKDDENFQKQSFPVLHTQDLSVPVSFKIDDSFEKTLSDKQEVEKVKPLHVNDKSEGENESDSDSSTSCFPVLRKSRSRSKSKERKLKKDKLKKKAQNVDSDNGHEIQTKNAECDKPSAFEGPQLLPKSGSGNLKLPPVVDRSSKPNTPPKSPVSSDEADGYEPVQNGTNVNKVENNGEHMPYVDSKPSLKERFPRFHRDHSKASAKRDSSRGSGYEPVGWGNDNLTNSNLNDSKDELGSKIYEDLDEVINLSSSAPHGNLESPGKQNQEQQKEDLGREQKTENDEHEKVITRGIEDQCPLTDKMMAKMGEKNQQTEAIMLKEGERDEDAKNKREMENTEKEKIEREEKETKRMAKEEKEINERVKKEKKAREEQELKEKKQREKMEREQAEMEAKEKKRIAKEQKEKDERLKKEQRKAQEMEEKERKLKEKVEKERNEREQKEKKKKEKEEKENEQRILKERKEAEELEAKETKIREKTGKENRDQKEQEQKKLPKDLKEINRKEEIDSLDKEENNSENIILKCNAEQALGIQNYDLQDVPHMIEKERLFDEETARYKDDIDSSDPKEKGTVPNGVFKKEDQNPVLITMSEHEVLTEASKLDSMNIATTSSTDEGEVDEHREKCVTSNLNPFEADETDLIDKAPTINTNTGSVKDSEMKSYFSQQTLDSASFYSLPSDSQVLDNHSKNNLEGTHIVIDDAIMLNNMENQSITTSLQTSLEQIQEAEDENKKAEDIKISNAQETNDVPYRITTENKDIHSSHVDACDQNDDGNTTEIKTNEVLNKEKEAQKQMKNKIKEEERINKLEEQKRSQLKDEIDTQRQKDLKKRWDGQDKEDTLNRKMKLKQKEQKQNEEKEIILLKKTEDEICKTAENEANRLRNEKLNQQQKELKDKWDELEKDNTLKREAKAKEKNNKMKEEIEMKKRSQEDEENRKLEENETRRIQKEKLDQQQREFKEKWDEQEKENTLKRETKAKDKSKKINEEIHVKKQFKDDEEKRKSEEKVNLRIKSKKDLEHQEELKKRWSEYEEDEQFHKQTKKEKEVSEIIHKKQSKTQQKEDRKKQLEEENEAMKLIGDKNKQRQNELKEKWIEQEKKRKLDTKEMKACKSKHKIQKPEDTNVIIETNLRNETKDKISELDDVKEQQSEAQSESIPAFTDYSETRSVPIVKISTTETEPEKYSVSEETDGKIEHQESVQHECYQEENDNTVESFDPTFDNVVYPQNNTSPGYENTENQVECQINDVDDNKKDFPVPGDDSEELQLLLQMLKKNDDSIANATTTADEGRMETENGEQLEKEDPEELKLLIQMLNEKHIPTFEKVSSTETELPESRIFPLRNSEENDGSHLESRVKVENSTGPMEIESTVNIKVNEKEIAEFEPKSVETNIKVETEKPNKEKEKQGKLQKEEKKKLEKQRKLEAKKYKEAKDKEMQLSNKEQQKILKEKWNVQEQERNKNEIEINKLIQEENVSKKTEGKEKLQLKNKQISEHQQELKKRWVEYEEEENFHKQAKSKEELKGKLDQKESTKRQKDESKKHIQEQIGIEKTETSINQSTKEICSIPKNNDVPEIKISETEDSIDGLEKDDDRELVTDEQLTQNYSNELEHSDNIPLEYPEELPDKLDVKTIENVNDMHVNLSKSEKITNQKENDINAKKIKVEKDKKIKLEKLEAEKIEKQKKLELKKIQDELDREAKIKNMERQKILKEKWIQQEQLRKKNKSQGKKEREKIDETTIRVIDYPEQIKEDPITSDNVNPLLMEYAESFSSDIMKEAKGTNTLESSQDVGDDTDEFKDSEGKVKDVMIEPEIVTHIPTQKSSKDEGLPPPMHISEEKYLEKDIIPVIPHSDVETLLRIIKETDDEFKEKEQQLLDEVERKKKEVNIKEMEKELKKQKRDQEKLKKENEKAQKKTEKLEKEALLKKEKEEKRNKKLMDAKLKKENVIEDQRLKKESLEKDIKDSEVDSRAKTRIDKEKQLALAKEMSQYRITPENEEEPTYEVDGKISGENLPELCVTLEDTKAISNQNETPFEANQTISEDLTVDADKRYPALSVGMVAPHIDVGSKDEPKHVTWTPKNLTSNKKEFQSSNVDEPPGIKVQKPFFRTKKKLSPQLPKIPSPQPSKELLLTQPEESEPRTTSVMATSLAGQRSDDLDDFAQFATGQPHQNGGGISPDGIEHDYGYEDDEMDFTPQNGYIPDEPEFVPYHEEEPKPATETKAPKERKSREPMKMPTVDIKGKLDAMKGIKMPSAQDMAESLNPMSSLKRPLGVRVREEDPVVQRERALVVKNSTPGQLGNLKHPLDIPMPKFRSRNKSAEATAKKAPKPEENGKESEKEDTSTPGKSKAFNTLPRSLRQQNLVTSVVVMDDPKVLEERKELIKNHTPAELAQIRGISDFPVPSKITNIFEKKEKEAKQNGHQEKPDAEPSEPWSLYGTLPRSMRETKILTNTREIVDAKEFENRQELIRSKSPAELAQIHGLNDIPVPTKIQNIFKTRSRSGSLSKVKRTRSESLGKRSGSMTFTLPKSWMETKLITAVKVEEDEAVLAQKKNLTETKTPNELSQITSIADLPIPEALQNFLKSDKKPRDPSREDAGSPIRINLDSMYDNLPRSLTQKQLLVKSKVEEDSEVLKKRQDMVATKKPAELAHIGGFGELPVPTALENIFKGGPPTAPRRKSKDDREGKRKRNFTTGGILSYDNVPDSLKTQLLVTSKVEEDSEVLQARQELTRTKTPNELGQMHGLDDFPLPEKLDTLMRPSKRNLKSTKEKQEEKKRSVSLSNLAGKISSASFPESMTKQLLVKAKMEDPEVQQQRQEIVNTKSVAELGNIHGMSEFPVPATLERLMDKNKRKSAVEPKSEDTRPLKDKMYDTLPKSMKKEILVKVRDEDPEIQKQRQELTRSKSPVELSQLSSISDFPVPTTFEKMLQKTSTPDGAPVPPPRRARLDNFNKDNLYERFPSLNTECKVRSRVLEDEEVIKERKELVQSKSPAELSEIHGLGEIPVPGFVEHSMDSLKRMRTSSRERKEGEDVGKGMYDKIPESLKSQLMVKSLVEDPEVQKERADVVKTKSVKELSQVTSFSDFPVPENIEKLVSRQPGAVERKKRFREKQRSLSAKNLNEMMPDSLKCQVLVKSKVEKPEIQRERAQLVSSKSVSELSQVTSISDIPIPTTLERMISKSKGDLTDGSSSQRTSRFDLSKFKSENIYATLPKSLTERQVLVKSRVEDPEMQKSRKELTEGKSVAELSQIHSMAEFPIPTTIETLIEKGRQSSQGHKDQPDRSAMSSPSQIKDNIYATLPKSLKSELAVTTKYQDPDVVQERREMLAKKSVNELSQVTTLSDVPIPSPIQKMIDTAQHIKDPKPEGDEQNKSRPSSRGPSYDIYASLPRSLKSELRVRNKVGEDNEKTKIRQNLVETKTPGELSQINSLSEVPVPKRIEAWLHGSSGMDQEASLPRNKQEIKDVVIKNILPGSMSKPCVVRSRIEDPEVLIVRQELQQQKSIHELSKIRNINEFPLPMNVKLPDIPLPSFKAKNILKAMAPSAKSKSRKTKQQEPDGEYTPASTPRTGELLTDDDMLRYDTSTPGGDASHRDQDFGYEMIDESNSPMTSGAPQHLQQIPAQFQEDILDHASPQIAVSSPEEDSIADQYRGTPPMKSKKKKPDRRSQSHEVSDNVQLGDEIPPPLPPKRPSSVKRELRDSPLASAGQETDVKKENDTIKSSFVIESPTIASTCLHEHVHTEFKDSTPNAPMRRKSPKTKVVPSSQTIVLKQEPKIGFSYTNDPHNTPTRHIPACRPEDIPLPKSKISQTQQTSQSDAILTVSKSSSSSRVPGGPVAHDDFLSCADDPVQQPGAPSSVHSSIRHSGSGHSFGSARSGVSNIPDQFHSVASTLHSGTLVDSNNFRRDDDDNTLAESIIDSMHSCADTMVTTGEDDAALHSCADTLAESDDEIDKFFADSPTPPIGSG